MDPGYEPRLAGTSGRVALQPQIEPVVVESDSEAGSGNAVSVVMPVEGYLDVARLVTGGFASQLSLGFETVDDIQLAIGLALHTIPLAGSRVTVALASRLDSLTIALGTFEEGSIGPGLRAIVRQGLSLEAMLGRLVDDVEVLDGSSPELILRKRLQAVQA